jgi:wyosine [tRNA(Phe)-imidazoG37] synthetase (radical SAM superfamily)
MIAFGPVPSRRLGKSLGINNISAHKKCSYSCVYCQIGSTDKVSVKREVFYESRDIVSKVEDHLNKLDNKDLPDYLTFVSNGEPTLDINLGQSIRALKQFGFPIAVITNSSLIASSNVRAELAEADWVSLKVDSIESEIWKRINRPSELLVLENILEGISIFAKSYNGELHTETMLISGINDSTESLQKNASFISYLNPKVSYISIPIRPPAVKSIQAASNERVAAAWQIYRDNGIRTELINGFEGTGVASTGDLVSDILNITAVHPLREDSLDLLIKQNNANFTIIKSLMEQNVIIKTNFNGYNYYLRILK